MRKELVPYKIAALAKDKGFNYNCLYHYFNYEGKVTLCANSSTPASENPVLEHPRSTYYQCGSVNTDDLAHNYFNTSTWKKEKAKDAVAIDCPTRSSLQRWLRKKHKIEISIRKVWYWDKQKGAYVYRVSSGNRLVKSSVFEHGFARYETAWNAALETALKSLK
jgi:hypothetical protein